MKRLPKGHKAQIMGTRMFQTMYTADQMRKFAQQPAQTVRPEYFTKDMPINDYLGMTLQHAGFSPDNTAMRNVLLAVFEEGARWQRGQTAQQQEPFAWLYKDSWGTIKLSNIMPPPVGAFPVYTSKPASKPWVGLTDDERGQVYANWRFNGIGSSNLELCRAIEAKLKEKNNG